MNRFTKSVFTAALLGVAVSASAQDMNSRIQAQDKPTRVSKAFRTFSIGIHGGVLTPYSIFGSRNGNEFTTPTESWGYGGFIAQQITPTFGLKADFLAGNVKGLHYMTKNAPGSYNSHIEWSGALKATMNLGNFSILNDRSFIAPFFEAGAGYMSSNADVSDVAGVQDRRYGENWFVPVGAGFKLGVAKGVDINLGYQVNFMKSDDFTGIPGGRNDSFSYGHAGIEYTFGDPNLPKLNGYSPIPSLTRENAELRRALTTQEDALRRERDRYDREMADDDNDGVANKFDKCPGTPAGSVVDGSGCPLKVPTPVIREKIIVTEADRKVVDEAIRNLEFDLGKATIRAKSFATLNRVAELLVQKNFSLKLAGHTDNTGSMALNMRLSKARAESVKAYLVSQGANASRIEATGYGPNQPIASNATAEGRQQNRRVEFTLY